MTDLKRNDGLISPDAALALSAFRVGVAAEQRSSHATGIAYPISDPEGHIAWVHPDGTRRAGMSADSRRLD